MLNSRRGMLALAGDNDMREVHRRVAAGDAAAELALDVYCYRIRKYVGAYLAALGGADAIVFTAGVGENDPIVRARSLAGLERLGIDVDPQRNAAGETVISSDGAWVKVLVIPTNEELEMATCRPRRWSRSEPVDVDGRGAVGSATFADSAAHAHGARAAARRDATGSSFPFTLTTRVPSRAARRQGHADAAAARGRAQLPRATQPQHGRAAVEAGSRVEGRARGTPSGSSSRSQP